MKKSLALMLLALWSSGCATHQLRFQPWQGIPAADLKDVQGGVFNVPADKLFDAAAATLEHEPYLHWTFDTLDKTNRLIIGSAGLFREVQVRVTDADGGRSRMAVSIPRRELKTQAKIYQYISDGSHQTAYLPDEKERALYTVRAADAVLDPDYFYSFTYRVLGDRSQVPFKLQSYDDAEAQGMAPAQDSAPTPAVAAPMEAPKPALTPTEKSALSPTGGAAAGISTPAAEGGSSLPPAHR